ncbi:hypothetical protein [Methylobacterium sp. ID0610]|uniref:hypothetical protein n=1 Tax=Methylobacterium carpenticola TaxID=3344827 RepID=UPI0036B3BD71
MITHAVSELLRDRLVRAAGRIQGRGWLVCLDELNAHAIQAYGAGQLLDEHADQVFQAIQSRKERMAASTAAHRSRNRAGGVKGCVTPLGAFAYDTLATMRASPSSSPQTEPRGDRPTEPPGTVSVPSVPRKRRLRVSHEERLQHQAQTRRRYYNGHRPPWPGTVKQDFHPAELSAIGIIFRDIQEHDVCDLALGTIAARARCCRRTVQSAIRWAAHRGHLSIEERVKDTHRIRLASDAIRAWLARVRPLGSGNRKETDDLNVPDKVAAAPRLPADDVPERPREAASPVLPAMTRSAETASAPAPRQDTAVPSGSPDQPPRLDAIIARWREAIACRKSERTARDLAPLEPDAVLQPG